MRKLNREFLIPVADIEWLHAEGNYVALHLRGHDYLLRSTMAAIEARIHRGYIVNLDLVTEIEPLEYGDARVLLRDGSRLPCSRNYREALKRSD